MAAGAGRDRARRARPPRWTRGEQGGRAHRAGGLNGQQRGAPADTFSGIAAAADSRFIEVEGLRLHYVEQGAGDPVLLPHGWPTSAYLWRNVMPAIAERNRAVAIDL